MATELDTSGMDSQWGTLINVHTQHGYYLPRSVQTYTFQKIRALPWQLGSNDAPYQGAPQATCRLFTQSAANWTTML